MGSLKHKKLRVIKIVGIALSGLLFAMVLGGLSFSLLRGALHLDFSQQYRQVNGVEKIRFREKRNHKIYARTFWGLCPVGKDEYSQGNIPAVGKDERQGNLQDAAKAEVEETEPAWLDTDVYGILASRDMTAWYDWQENKIFLGNLKGEILQAYEMQYDTVEHIAFSKDGNYILFYEKEYGVNGGYSTDEEYCYYRVIDIESGKQYTVYSGYRQWFDVYWE